MVQQYADKIFHIILKHIQVSNSAQPKKPVQKKNQRNWCFHSLLGWKSGTQAQPTAWRLHREVYFGCLYLSACSHISFTESDNSGRLKVNLSLAYSVGIWREKKKKKETIHIGKFYILIPGAILLCFELKNTFILINFAKRVCLKQ